MIKALSAQTSRKLIINHTSNAFHNATVWKALPVSVRKGFSDRSFRNNYKH